MDETLRVVEMSRRLAAALSPGDLDQTLHQVTAAAVEVLPEVSHASISVRHADGRLETAAPTDPVLLELDRVQYDLHEGPRYAPHALAEGIRAQAGIRLFDARDSRGAINLYSRDVGAFRDLEVVGQLFVHHAATALEYARQIDNLTTAMQSRQLVGQAVGVVMERFGLDEARAFAFLTRMAAQHEIKVREVARRLLEETADQR